MRLRVLTFNVRNDDGPERRPELINREIRRLDPDIVALQEVPGGGLDRLVAGSGLSATHQDDVLSFAMPFADRYGGTAVASRWPHRVVESLDQRGADAPDVPWCTLGTMVDVPDLGPLLFIATTFSWRLNAEAARERQAVAVTDLDARHRVAVPTIIAGDLNAGPDAACVRYLSGRQSLRGRSVSYHDAWRVANPTADPRAGATWAADNPSAAAEIDAIVRQPGHSRRLDYVFVGSWDAHPNARAEVRAATVVFDTARDDTWLSDHHGLLVDLDVSVDS